MRRLKLVNIASLGLDAARDRFAPFTVDRYTFHSDLHPGAPPLTVNTSLMASRANRIHRQNAYVEFAGHQEDSIIFRGGLHGSAWRPQKRKFIDDILLLGSLLTARNWALFSRRHYAQFPVVPVNRLRAISDFRTELAGDLATLIAKIKNPEWQRTFDSGFHVRALLNKANILNIESRFLSGVILWELVYSKLFAREEDNLHTVIKEVLQFYWPGRVDTTVFTNGRVRGVSRNIIYVLRNQLAHSGRLPIDRPYAEEWMKRVPAENAPGGFGITLNDYLSFFGDLTQVVVMKTLDFHPENRQGLSIFDFGAKLQSFLSTGRLG